MKPIFQVLGQCVDIILVQLMSQLKKVLVSSGYHIMLYSTMEVLPTWENQTQSVIVLHRLVDKRHTFHAMALVGPPETHNDRVHSWLTCLSQF